MFIYIEVTLNDLNFVNLHSFSRQFACNFIDCCSNL